MIHKVTLMQYVVGSGDARRDFQDLVTREYEVDQTHYIELLTPAFADWMVAFFARDFLSTDYEVIDVEVYHREGPTSEGGIQSPQAGSTPMREGLAGPLAGASDSPPSPLSYYPNRINPIQPWTPTA